MHMYCINIPYQMPCKIHAQTSAISVQANACSLDDSQTRHEESTTLALLGRIKMEAERYIVRPDRQNDEFSKAIA